MAKKIPFRVPMAAATSSPDTLKVDGFERLQRFEGELTRGEDASKTFEADEKSVVRLDFSDGTSRWVRADELKQEVATRDGGVDLSLAAATTTRGAISTLLKGVEFFFINTPEKNGFELCDAVEKKAIAKDGLFRLGEFNNEDFFSQAQAVTDLKSGKTSDTSPYLLLIHGTASSIPGGFVGLAEEERRATWNNLSRGYGDRFLAFNHKSLTVSPITNALNLLDKLPENAKLHMVTHSRGGLVGELLCLQPGQVGPAELELFENALQRDALKELCKQLLAKKPVVERFVRVGCPAAGTNLASGRLDRYFQAIANALQFLVGTGVKGVSDAGLPGTGKFAKKVFDAAWDHLEKVILAVVETRCRPDVLPGLEAMMPGSALIRLLNNANRTTTADLTAVAGDVGKSLNWKDRLIKLGLDLIFLESNDWVVDTRSMYGGLKRPNPRYFLVNTGEIYHLNYFKEKATFDAVCQGLRGQYSQFQPITSEETAKPGFAKSIKFALSRDSAIEKKPVVFVLPGAMGSVLSAAGSQIWLSPLQIAAGRFSDLKLPEKVQKVIADDVLAPWYGELCEYLSASHEVVVFPYDWRISPLDEGERLGREVKSTLSQLDPKQPVRFLCHSLGGLVMRGMMVRHPEVYKAVCDRGGSQTVMLGVPNNGSYAALQMMTGVGGVLNIINLLAAWDLHNPKSAILETVHTFPGLLALLPAHDEEMWRATTWTTIFKACKLESSVATELLLQAKKGWQELSNAIDTERMVYVAGLGSKTPIGYDPKARDWFGRVALGIRTTPEGDGTVPWADCAPQGVPVYYNVEADHGHLPSSRSAFEAYLDLLNSRVTQRNSLTNRKPAASYLRDASEDMVFQDEAAVYPTQSLIEAAAMGAQSLRDEASAGPKPQLRVQVVHGDLRYASSPVVLGHYANQPMEGTQKALNRCLGQRLSEDRALGVYPGPVGSVRLYLKPNAQKSGEFPGGIILGLGDFGKISPTDVSLAVRQATIEFSLWRRENPGSPNGLSFLLIASMEGGLTLHESVNSILNGVLEANLILGQVHAQPLAEIQLLELWEDRVVETLHAVKNFSKSPRSENQITVMPEIQEVAGHLRRVSNLTSETEWHRLQVRESRKRPGMLIYNLLTRRARNEASRVGLENRLMEGFLARSSARAAWQPELSHTLFELLIPNRLKDMADDGRNLLLLLDEGTARFPWELLIDGKEADKAKPVSTRACMIRQLESAHFRENPISSQLSNALVVGDPPSELPPLPGAQVEAREVAELLKQAGYSVNHLDTPEGDQVVRALFSKDYRILHLSGHGSYERKGKKVKAGMVIGKGLLLSSNTLAQLRVCPELVFINCCHLGKIDQQESHFHELAANISTEMIRAGSRAVIAAGWAVEDRSAHLFAQTFYTAMLNGEKFGVATLTARQAVYAAYPQFNTWGAYQCYGDPDYRLFQGLASGSKKEKAWASKAEVIVALENLAQSAEVCPLQEHSHLVESLQSYRDGIPEHWIGTGTSGGDERVLLALARCNDQLIHPLFGLTETNGTHISRDAALNDSLAYYLKLARFSSMTVNDIAINQRLKLLSHFSETPCPQTVDEILQERESLAKWSANDKAWSRVGGAAMTALLLPKPDKKALLEKMLTGYEEALKLKPIDPYYEDYAHMARLALNKKVEPLAELPPIVSENSFKLLAGPRRKLLIWIANDCKPLEYGETLANELDSVWLRGSSPFKFKSILELFEFLLKLKLGNDAAVRKLYWHVLRVLETQA